MDHFKGLTIDSLIGCLNIHCGQRLPSSGGRRVVNTIKVLYDNTVSNDLSTTSHPLEDGVVVLQQSMEMRIKGCHFLSIDEPDKDFSNRKVVVNIMVLLSEEWVRAAEAPYGIA